MEFFRGDFYYQKRNISHIKNQSVAANLTNFPDISPSISLWNSASPASGCWWQGLMPLPRRYLPRAVGEHPSAAPPVGLSVWLVPTGLPYTWDSWRAGTRSCLPLRLGTRKDPPRREQQWQAGPGAPHQSQSRGRSLQLCRLLKLFMSIAELPLLLDCRYSVHLGKGVLYKCHCSPPCLMSCRSF